MQSQNVLNGCVRLERPLRWSLYVGLWLQSSQKWRQRSLKSVRGMGHSSAVRILTCGIGCGAHCCGQNEGQHEQQQNFWMTGKNCASAHSFVLHMVSRRKISHLSCLSTPTRHKLSTHKGQNSHGHRRGAVRSL